MHFYRQAKLVVGIVRIVRFLPSDTRLLHFSTSNHPLLQLLKTHKNPDFVPTFYQDFPTPFRTFPTFFRNSSKNEKDRKKPFLHYLFI